MHTSESTTPGCSLVLPVLLAAALALACGDQNASGPCVANVDCPGLAACLDGKCITDPAGCTAIGAFADIVEAQPQNADQIFELHTTIAPGGAVHYCYFGLLRDEAIAFYGVQTSWNQFNEKPLSATDSAPARCGALAVDQAGNRFVLSRSPPAVLWQSAGTDTWQSAELTGLLGIEARGALLGDRTLITLTPDEHAGLYIAMSLGFELTLQPVYLAHLAADQLHVLVNSWTEDGSSTLTGHAPQFLLVSPEPRVLMGKVLGFDVVLADDQLNAIGQVEGLHPRGAVGPDGAAYALRIDHNFQLRLDEITDSGFSELANLGIVGLDESGDGQVPWDLAIDSNATAHLLLEDQTQGPETVIYRTVSPTGEPSDPIITTTALAELPGMQRYALSCDICNRATVVTVNTPNTGWEQDLPVIRIIEGR